MMKPKHMILFFVVFLFFTHCAQPEKTITILHFNDVYNIEPMQKGKIGGAARVATVIQKYQKENPLILFSGDALSSSYMSLYLKGKQMIGVFNALGLDKRRLCFILIYQADTKKGHFVSVWLLIFCLMKC